MYPHQELEKKWQEAFERDDIYHTAEKGDRPKYYILDMFPYPSGEGLHVGHPKGYIATDIFARLKMMQGYNVLHPMGWDAFGLPAENYAIKNKIHPKIAVEKNIATFKKQLRLLGLSYDWSREVNTTDPNYYKWTQWAFLKLLEKGLAYESYEPINWCPGCKTGLANEDLEDGKCERCGSEIEKKPMRQWVLKITDYAERLLNDLEKLPEWEESIKEMQKNWIGKSEGAELDFTVNINSLENKIRVFTTRPDTLFGCTYVVLAPEHKLIETLKDKINNWSEVEAYILKAKNKSDLERTDLNKEKSGVILGGIKAVNPVNNEEVPIFIADYVLINYGTGAIMAVPAHDERDFEFAKKYQINIKIVVKPIGMKVTESTGINAVKSIAVDKVEINKVEINNEVAFTEEGININSDFLNDLSTSEAKKKMITWLEEKGIGLKKINYRLQDWVFSRQRYWGEPIPVVHCKKCGAVPLPEDQLPLLLPEVENYEPSGTGESPLATISDWVNTTCPKCGGSAQRETNTMPQWAGSCWYYLRYIDPQNNLALVDKEKEKYWSPIDFYVGGAEHATRHLIYARFWHKFLYDIGAVSYDEPFTKLQHVGLIMAEDGKKMSKRWGNIINPDSVVENFGADAMRVYEMFMGPFNQACAWSANGLTGARKFLEKVYKLREKVTRDKVEDKVEDKKLKTLLNKTVKKVGEDISGFRFNTAVSALMILVNEMETREVVYKDDYEALLKILSPFAPYLSQELWQSFGYDNYILRQSWPSYDANFLQDDTVQLAVQINGKMRATIEVPFNVNESSALEAAKDNEVVKKWLEGVEIIKAIFVPGRLLNIVVK